MPAPPRPPWTRAPRPRPRRPPRRRPPPPRHRRRPRPSRATGAEAAGVTGAGAAGRPATPRVTIPRIPAVEPERWRVRPGEPLDLAALDPASTEGAPGDKEETEAASDDLRDELIDLQARLWAESS